MKVVWEQVSFTYPGQTPAGENAFSMGIKDGETILLLGPSGSGKSTLALCLCGIIPHAIAGELAGHVKINGVDTESIELGELAREVGMVFQDPESQAVMMMVEDEVAFGLENIRVPHDQMEERITQALDKVGLSAHRSLPIDRLSGGQKQRLALASVLAMEPHILVLDEPTSNLDSAGTEDVFRTLSGLKASGRHTIILIEHKLDNLMNLVDRVAVIDRKGNLVCSGPPEAIFYNWENELEELGVWVPKAVEWARKMRMWGVPIQGTPLSIEQLVDAVPSMAHIISGVNAEDRFLEDHPSSTCMNRPANAELNHMSPLFLEIRPTGLLSFRTGWLQPLELKVRRGEFWAIVGENGAGKTTLARHIMGLSKVRPGMIFIDGRDSTTYPAHELARRIGYVFQNPEHQFVTERVWDEVAFGLKGLGLSQEEITLTVDRLLTRFGLSSYAQFHPFALSHGQKRRLSVAIMLAVGQELIILDEPTFGQDRHHAVELMDMLKELQREGRTILMISHDMALVAEYAEFVAVLSRGMLLSSGPVNRLFEDNELMAQAGLRLPPSIDLIRRLTAKLPSGYKLPILTIEQWKDCWRSVAEAQTETQAGALTEALTEVCTGGESL